MRRKAWLGVTMLATAMLVLTGVALAQDGARRGWLGIYSQELTDELRDGLDFDGEGVLITRVIDDSPADRGGLRKGDVVLSIAGRSVDSPDELASAVRAHDTGDEVTVRVFRDGERRSLTVRLGSRPGDRGRVEIETPKTPRAPRAPEPPEPPSPPDLDVFRFEHDDHDKDGDKVERRVFRFSNRGRLGVRIEDLNEDHGGAYDRTGGRGALVVEVVEDSPAEKAGIKPGDVITRVGNDRIDDSADLIQTLSGQSGRTTVEVSRRGSSRTFEVELETAPGFRRGPQTFEWRGPNATRRVAPRSGDNEAELRDQVRALREELRRLEEELEELKRR